MNKIYLMVKWRASNSRPAALNIYLTLKNTPHQVDQWVVTMSHGTPFEDSFHLEIPLRTDRMWFCCSAKRRRDFSIFASRWRVSSSSVNVFFLTIRAWRMVKKKYRLEFAFGLMLTKYSNSPLQHPRSGWRGWGHSSRSYFRFAPSENGLDRR